MGKAARWLRGLLGGKKKKAPEPARDSTQKPPAKEKKGWGLTRSFRDKERGLCEGKEVAGGARGWPAPVGSRVEEKGSSYREAARSYGASAHSPGYSCCSSTACGSAASGLVGAAVVAGDDDEQQSKRAIAVAAATAAVAEAAVAAAQAAAAVVRLTSKEGRAHVSVSDWRSKEWAAVKIQSAFRGYLARRALKALKGLVKIQALVRGHVVRKQAAETMRCMQALVRVQARARAGRTLPDNQAPNKSSRHHHHGPPNPRKNGTTVHVNGAKPDRSNTLRRNASRVKNSGSVDPNTLHPSGWNWLDRWMEDRYWNNNKSSKTGIGTDDEKILEIDAGKPHINSKWRNRTHSMCSTLASDQISHSFMAMPESPSRNSAIAQHSIPSTSSVDMQQQSLSPLRFPLEASQPCESPQYYSASSRLGSSRRGPFTPSKSDCSRSVFSGYPDWPNYMSNTESSKAKARSHSAPKQRPDYEKSNGARRHSGQGSGVSDLSSLSSQRSSSLHHKFAGKLYPGSGRLDRLGMPIGM